MSHILYIKCLIFLNVWEHERMTARDIERRYNKRIIKINSLRYPYYVLRIYKLLFMWSSRSYKKTWLFSFGDFNFVPRHFCGHQFCGWFSQFNPRAHTKLFLSYQYTTIVVYVCFWRTFTMCNQHTYIYTTNIRKGLGLSD